MSWTITYRQNGTGNAYLRELGCACPQCSAPIRKPQTSGSLFIHDGVQPRFHLLFDCGFGVVDSLIDAGAAPVTHVFVSHNHPDHCLELDRLAQSLRRSARRAGRDVRTPCYCTAGTREQGPDRLFPYLPWERINVTPAQSVTPYETVGALPTNPGLGAGLRITPFAVYHGNPAIVPEPVIWVVEFSLQGETKKIVLAWDLLHLIPRHEGEDRDALYHGPVAGKTLDPTLELLRGADLLVLAGNSWTPQPATGHTSITTGLAVTIPLLAPRGPTWLVHYSGHEDTDGPLSDADLADRIVMEATRRGARQPIVLAQPGDTAHF